MSLPARSPVSVTLGAVAGLLLLPAPASATNCSDLPVPPTYEGLQCITVVDRSASATVHVDYTYDPLALEVLQGPQSVSLFAFPFKPTKLPRFLTMDDWQYWKEFFEGTDCAFPDEPMEGDILELNDELKDSYWIVAPERAVTLEEAENGFEVDTSDLPEGNYFLYAYNLVGAFNGFTLMPSGWRVVDSEDADIGPSVFVEDIAEKAEDVDFYYPGQEYAVTGCTVAAEGSEVDIAWSVAVIDPSEEETWNPIAACMPAGGTMEFDVPVIFPQETNSQSIRFRAVLTDPEGRSMEAKSSYFFMGPQTVDCTDPNVPVKPPLCEDYEPGDPDSLPDLDFCGQGDSGDDDSSDDSGEGDSGGNDDTDDDAGTGGDAAEGDDAGDGPGADGEEGTSKGCRIDGSHPRGWAALAGIGLLGLTLRRRR